MRKFILLASVFFTTSLFSQTIDYAREIVKTLSSEEFSGRGYSSGGIDKAAEYIKSEFQKNGLQSMNGDYFQYFPVDVNTFPGKLSLKIDEKELVPGADYIVDPSSPGLNGSFKVKTFRINKDGSYGGIGKVIKALKNKVLVIDERGVKVEGKVARENYNSFLQYLKYNQDLKHKALVVITDNKLTWHIAPVQSARPVFLVNSTIDIDNTEEIEINVESELKKNFNTCNVIGFHSGSVEPDSLIVLTAHYDHLGELGSETFIPGANDNASGIALMLSLAKYFQENPPHYSVLFVATTAEELGLLGARHFVENPPIDLKRIKFLVNFDLAGTGEEGIKVVNGSVYKHEFDRLQKINQEQNYLPAIRIRGEACISDHCMFYMKGVPCFYIYTLGGIKAYHDIYDKYETLPFTEFIDYSNLMIDFIKGF